MRMLSISDAARDKLQAALDAKTDKGLAVRLSIIGRGKEGFRYDFRMIFRKDQRPDDTTLHLANFDLLIDADSVTNLEGAALDVKEDGSGFKIDNPNPVWIDPKGPLILDIIENKVNPGVALHGGHVTLVDVRDDVVYISFGGGCQGCGLANVTLKQGVHKMLKEAVPEIREIVDMTDHALGVNPFYHPGMAGQSPVSGSPAEG
jgi:Fe/S biogenesis protein NfuA